VIIVLTCIVAIAVIAFVLGVRPKDIPAPEPVSPFAHLDERKAAIYENLRDLQFEYRVGKLSDADYQSTKKDLQRELAGVLAEVDRLKAELLATTPAPKAKASRDAPPSRDRKAAVPTPAGFTCDACGATFKDPLKFCGECGKPMKVGQL
jgi:hypothetical protein